MNREIEKKFLIKTGMSKAEVDYIIQREFDPTREYYGSSEDLFFLPQDRTRADFIRLRALNDGTTELTIKKKDRGNNTDRMEQNIDVHPFNKTREFCRTLFGPELTTLNKTFSHFERDGIEVSTALVEGYPYLILEVEAPTEAQIERVTTVLSRVLPLEVENQSLFELFVKPLIPVTWGDFLIGGRN
jgi:CYTH domain-containing protein